jgi:putrescine transport system permease protein
LYIPLFFVVISAFSESDVPGIWTRFSLKWFILVFTDKDLLRAALASVEVAAISATTATILGTISATAIVSKEDYLWKRTLSKLIIVPILLPEIIAGFSLLMLFMIVERMFNISQERGLVTVAIGHTMASVAYVHTTVKSRLSSFDLSLEEAARDLGANPLISFIRIKLPSIWTSIWAGWLLAFTISIDDLVIASFLTGPGATTLPLLIFSNIKVGITPAINAFATMLMAIVLMCTLRSTKSSTKSKNAS